MGIFLTAGAHYVVRKLCAIRLQLRPEFHQRFVVDPHVIDTDMHLLLEGGFERGCGPLGVSYFQICSNLCHRSFVLIDGYL